MAPMVTERDSPNNKGRRAPRPYEPCVACGLLGFVCQEGLCADCARPTSARLGNEPSARDGSCGCCVVS